MELYEAGCQTYSRIVLRSVSRVKERVSRHPQELFVCMCVFSILSTSSRQWVGVLIPDPISNPLSICSVLVVSIGPTWDAHDIVPELSGTLPRFEVMGYILRLREVVVRVSLFVFCETWRTLLSWAWCV